MYPHERSLVKRLENEPFALIGVNSDKDLAKLKPRLAAENITWRSFWNGEKGTSGPISARWNVMSWPTIYVIDAKGVIRFKNTRGEAMDKAVDTLLAEMKAAGAVTPGAKMDSDDKEGDDDDEDGDDDDDEDDDDDIAPRSPLLK